MKKSFRSSVTFIRTSLILSLILFVFAASVYPQESAESQTDENALISGADEASAISDSRPFPGPRRQFASQGRAGGRQGLGGPPADGIHPHRRMVRRIEQFDENIARELRNQLREGTPPRQAFNHALDQLAQSDNEDARAFVRRARERIEDSTPGFSMRRGMGRGMGMDMNRGMNRGRGMGRGMGMAEGFGPGPRGPRAEFERPLRQRGFAPQERPFRYHFREYFYDPTPEGRQQYRQSLRNPLRSDDRLEQREQRVERRAEQREPAEMRQKQAQERSRQMKQERDPLQVQIDRLQKEVNSLKERLNNLQSEAEHGDTEKSHKEHN
ncbi:MAG: hypothetical protein ACOX5R_15430 [bacterium]|jgi:hypothetical protein